MSVPPDIVETDQRLDAEIDQKIKKMAANLLNLSFQNRWLNFDRNRAVSLAILDVPGCGALLSSLTAAGDTGCHLHEIPDPAVPADGIHRRDWPSAMETWRSLGHPGQDSFPGNGQDDPDQAVRFQTACYDHELQKRGKKIEDDDRRMLQETGLPLTRLCLGFLFWDERIQGTTGPASGDLKRAPLLSIPVSVKRHRRRGSRFVIHSAGELEDNETLAVKLDKSFGLRLPRIGDLEEDGDPVDAYLSQVASVIADMGKVADLWSVKHQAAIANLPYDGSGLRRDLSSPVLKAHALVRRILKGDRQPSDFGTVPDFDADMISAADSSADRLRDFPTLVLDADSSQMACLVDALKRDTGSVGRNLAVEGPPGTGKSQTIVNLIAAAMADGRSVLFVSQKRAAMEVVKRKLDEAGLGPLCLAMHADRAKKTELARALKDRLALHYDRQDRPPVPMDRRLEDDYREAWAGLARYARSLNAGADTRDDLFTAIWTTELANLNLGSDRLAAEDIDLGAIDGPSRRAISLAADYGETAADWQAHGEDTAIQGVTPLPGVNATDVRDRLKLAADAARQLLETGRAAQRSLGPDCPPLAETADQADQAIAALTDLVPPTGRSNLRTSLAGYDENRLAALADFAQSLERLIKFFGTDWLRVGRNDLPDETMLADLTDGEDLDLLDGAQQIAKTLAGEFDDVALAGFDLSDHEQDIIATIDALPEFDNGPDEDFWHFLKTHQNKYGSDTPSNYWNKHRNWLMEESSKIWNISEAALDRDPDEIRQIGRQLEKYFRGRQEKDIPIGEQNTKVYRKLRPLTANDSVTPLELYKDLLQIFKKREIVSESIRCQPMIRIVAEWMNIPPVLADALLAAENSSGLHGLNELRNAIMAAREQDAWGFFWAALAEAGDLNATRRQLASRERAQSQARQTLRPFGRRAMDNPGLFAARLKHIDAALVERDTWATEIPALDPSVVDWPAAVQDLPEIARWRGVLAGFAGPFKALAQALRDDPAAGRVTSIATTLNDLRRAQSPFVTARRKLEAAVAIDWPGVGSAALPLERLPLAEVSDLLARFADAPSLTDRKIYDDARRRAIDAGLAALVDAIEDGRLPPHRAGDAVAYGLGTRRRDRLLAGDHLDPARPKSNLQRDFRQWDRELLQVTRNRIADDVIRMADVPPGGGGGSARSMTDLVLLEEVSNKPRVRLSLRQIATRAGGALRALFPCFMLSPTRVAEFLPLTNDPFDIVIIDEASQLPIEEALGAIARAKQLFVVGDENQMPPTTLWQMQDTDDAADDDVVTASESILEACQRGFDRRRLLWHYRSQDHRLIDFSNRRFYNSELVVFPTPHALPERGIRLVKVPPDTGQFLKGRNPGEARRVVEEVFALLRADHQAGRCRSISVVAMNAAQRDLVTQLMDQSCASAEDLSALRDRVEGQHGPIEVKNLENMQGDESDIVVASMTYGPDSSGRFANRLGPINEKGGWRRLNVLFTRARELFVVVSSIPRTDLRGQPRDGDLHSGPIILREYLKYAEDGGFRSAYSTGRGYDSPFEAAVGAFLATHDIPFETQVGVEKFRIDMAVRHPQDGDRFILGIECDGATYHSHRTARDRDRIRQERLEALGWTLYRIWSTDWFNARQKSEKDLLDAIASAQAAARQEAENAVATSRKNGTPADEGSRVQPLMRTAPGEEESEAEPESAGASDADTLSDEDAAVEESGISYGWVVTYAPTEDPEAVDMREIVEGVVDEGGRLGAMTPLGYALMAKATGDVVEIPHPDGTRFQVMITASKPPLGVAAQ